MKAEIFEPGGFCLTLIIALLIRSYYRTTTFPRRDRYSTFGPRFWSSFVDAAVLAPIGLLVSVLLRLDLSSGLAAALVIVDSLAWIVYTIWMHAGFGQTVGKMVTRVRVVDFRTEGRISFKQALLREGIPLVLSLGIVGYQVVALVNGSLPPEAFLENETGPARGMLWLLILLNVLWFVAEVLTMLTNPQRRALHDFIAGTVVVRTNVEEASVLPGSRSSSVPTAGPLQIHPES
jgi:uncharacterized RDD family membrane protein YckC